MTARVDRGLIQKVRTLVSAELESRFGDSFVFGPIEVTEKFDLDDNPYLRVRIVFEGGMEKERLEELAKGALGLITAVENKLAEQAEVEDLLLLPSYIQKTEWDEEVVAATA